MVSPGLYGAESISFESVTNPGRYLRSRGGSIFIESGDMRDQQFRLECSWMARMDHFFTGFISFESVGQPGSFIRHKSRRLQLSTIDSNTDRNDASFIMSDLSGGGAEVYVEEVWKQLLNTTLLVESKAVPGHYWSWQENSSGSKGRLEVEGHVFRMIPGLWGVETVSFESTTLPGYYLRGRENIMWVEAGNLGSEAFRKECSFNARDGRFFAGYTSFEAADRPDQWIRQSDRQLKLETVSTYQDNNDASFFLSEAEPKIRTTTSPPPTTTRRPPPPPSRRTRPTRPPTTPAPAFVARGPSKSHIRRDI